MSLVSLERVYKRKKPRSDWPQRWKSAGDAVGWLGVVILPNEEESMIAETVSPVWMALSNGEGGFKDATKKGEPPFAFNSGLAWVWLSDKDVEFDIHGLEDEQIVSREDIKEFLAQEFRGSFKADDALQRIGGNQR